MDEITLLGRAVPDAPPPSPQAVTRARARLTAAERRPAGHRPPGRGSGWTWALACAAATAAVTLAVVFLAGGPAAPSPVTPPTVSSAPSAPSVEPPATYQGLRILRSETSQNTAAKITLRFRPTSAKTAIVLRCSEPGSLVLASEARDDGLSEAYGVCGPDGTRSRFDDKSYEPGWTSRTHTVTFWVFPPDAPILSGRDAHDCDRAACGGKYKLSTESAGAIAARLGERPQPWSVTVYDSPR
ncbi:hypothetical protein GCM10010156_73780 [Planobispora rosea]|uniref:Uncharacterized protein n=1 Tax=Planobispora rosea TaxID=35762 RepID=A0A8J3WGL7_PLARO|nr:hypothetical protein [Planobispora rosea]GGT05295.1 hypothetical protein GCM10010156_73780 [Planobispora rosea]GIH88685.1 hypothetical protein Pro02_70930 [Planobispora rosea]